MYSERGFCWEMATRPGCVAARAKPCHLPACTKQHLIHSLVLSIDHNKKHLLSGAPTRDFFISTGWPISATWLFWGGLWCHQALIDSLPSIIFFVREDLVQNVNLIYALLSCFAGCSSLCRVCCLIITELYVGQRGGKFGVVSLKTVAKFHFRFQSVIKIIWSVSYEIFPVGISLCRDKNQTRLNLESMTCKDGCTTVLRIVGNL
jgi:hypothetical protein